MNIIRNIKKNTYSPVFSGILRILRYSPAFSVVPVNKEYNKEYKGKHAFSSANPVFGNEIGPKCRVPIQIWTHFATDSVFVVFFVKFQQLPNSSQTLFFISKFKHFFVFVRGGTCGLQITIFSGAPQIRGFLRK